MKSQSTTIQTKALSTIKEEVGEEEVAPELHTTTYFPQTTSTFNTQGESIFQILSRQFIRALERR